MRKKLTLALILFCLLFSSSLALASGFDNSYLRLKSIKSFSALSGTVCAQPSSTGAGVENKIAITFPSDFSLSSTTSNWSTNTSNLPAGSTSWPGIGSTASNISGQTVTFSSSDLTSSLLYCFNFTATGSTTGAAGNDKNGVLATKNSSNNTIDSTTYATSIVGNNEINITASVDGSVSDLPVLIESLTPGTQFPQDTIISYRITYGSNESASLPLTIQAEWSQGTIDGSPTPSVDILDYVIGSATNAYNSTPPIIDTVNRTITWTITSFPGNTTGQTVTFSLKTNDSYTGSNLVHFTVSARAMSGSTITPDDLVNQDYLYQSSLTPTPTLTPIPTQAPGSPISPTPTPEIEANSLEFTEISIRSISSTDARVLIKTNNNALLTLSYAADPSFLSKTIKTLTYDTQNLILLPDLQSETSYYFKVLAKDENGKQIISDIFVLKTAIVSAIPQINLESLIVTSKDNILLNASQTFGARSILAIPKETVFTVQFSLAKKVSLENIQAIIRNKNVLGFSTLEQPDASSNFVNLVEIQTGIYTGKVSSPQKTGDYELYVRLKDYGGNIDEQKIIDLRVTNRMRVLKKGSNTPIENARVLLYLYNEATKTYSAISSKILPIENPTYSAPDGRFNTLLPLGNYKAEISALGFHSKTIEFAINLYEGDYPQVYLEQEQFNVVSYTQYYLNTFFDSIAISQDSLANLANSNRLLDFTIFSTLFVFIIISFMSLHAKTNISFIYLPYFLIYKTKILFKRHRGYLIIGRVMNKDSGIPITKANVSLIDPENNKTVASVKTNKLGEFYFENKKNKNYKISISKKGFYSLSPSLYSKHEKEIFTNFTLEKEEEEKYSIMDMAIIYFETFLGTLLEFLVLIGIIFEVYFIFTFGFLRILPFLILSFISLASLFLFIYKPRALQ